ncbi:MAG: hypothetical protein ACYSWO_00640 [Planctomycetota bacterium]|jgi:hypothetical protein
MKTQTDEVDEMLMLGRYMGQGERYLMLYGGKLAITNRTGLARWPKGRRQMIAIFDASDYVHGLIKCRRKGIFERLRSLKNLAGPNEGECESRVTRKLSHPLYPT